MRPLLLSMQTPTNLQHSKPLLLLLLLLLVMLMVWGT